MNMTDHQILLKNLTKSHMMISSCHLILYTDISVLTSVPFISSYTTPHHTQVVDLIPGGRHVPVTDENKAEYVRLVAHHRMTAAIRSQVRYSTVQFKTVQYVTVQYSTVQYIILQYIK